ncbi:MAG: 4a-hydroxytetrahydrobiopterin dehydratase [bacterium]
MSDLSQQHCEPCEGGIEPMSPGEAEEYLEKVDGWSLATVPKIKRQYDFKDFVTAIDFVNRVAEIAEDEGHHPNLEIDYNTVMVTVWTHAIDGLSENDFILAAKIDDAAEDFE